MVLITATEEEQCDQRLVIACGDTTPNMAQPGEKDSATTSPVATPSPVPSPSSHQVSVQKTSPDPREDMCDAQNDVKKPFLANGGTLAEKLARNFLGKNSAISLMCNTVVKEEKEEEEEEPQQFAAEVKQEQELDAPLDFSIKRRDSPSEGISTKPPHPHLFSSPSPRHSPDSNQQQAVLHSRQYEQGQGQDHDVDKSASPGEPKPKLGAKISSGSPAAINSSLATLGIVSDGSGVGVTPAALTAVLGKNGAIAPPLGNVPSVLEEARKLQAVGSGKVQRPFKAYPKEVLRMPLGYLGLPGVSPFPSMDPSYVQGLAVRPEELMTVYKQQTELLKEREKQTKNSSKRSSRSPPSSAVSPSPTNGRNPVTRTSPPPPSSMPASPSQPSQSSVPSTHTDSPSPGASVGSHASSTSQTHANLLSLPDANPDTDSTLSTLPVSTAAPLVSSTSSVTAAAGNRKRARNFPDSEKDDAYWERRRKNNDAAKRSRDARRAKEDEIALRAALLEQENLRLRVEVATLKTETARLRCLLYKT